jgi:hypothetical protein
MEEEDENEGKDEEVNDEEDDEFDNENDKKGRKKQVRVFKHDWLDKADFKDEGRRIFVYDDVEKLLKCQYCIDHNTDEGLNQRSMVCLLFFRSCI